MMIEPGTDERIPGSFRDPDGFIFRRGGTLYRAIGEGARGDFERLIDSGLYAALARDGRMVTHDEVSLQTVPVPGAVRVIRPREVPFVSYPYEWCFSQLKDAALLTLTVQTRALESGMSLKDASAYNVQFLEGRPVLIDSLSFAQYREGEPWVAYRQFCQHFLAPLALMSRTDVRLSQLLRVYIDGIPLDLASRLLPGRTRLTLGLGSHIHMHAKMQQKYADRPARPTGRKSSRLAMQGIISSLEMTVKGLRWEPTGTEWAGYYDETNYSPEAFDEKGRFVRESLTRLKPGSVWDLGANTGRFSRVAADMGILTIASDIDPAAVERDYLDCRARGEKHLLPLVLDLTNPSPGLGWANAERDSFMTRGPADCVLALALIHHLAIGNNLPLGHVADFLARVGRHVVVEFVPKSDTQVQRLLATREDVFPDYRVEAFEAELGRRFEILDRRRAGDSERTLYLAARRGAGR